MGLIFVKFSAKSWGTTGQPKDSVFVNLFRFECRFGEIWPRPVVKSERVMRPAVSTRKHNQALDLLGLNSFANHSDIRAAWRRMAFETHPDRPGGSVEAFRRVNEAYEILSSSNDTKRWTPPPQPDPKPQTTPEPEPDRPNRPRVRTSIVELTESIADLCRAELNDHEAAAYGSMESSTCEDTVGHVPVSVRRKGRNVSYIVRTPLQRGTNCVAVPAGELESRKKGVRPETVNLNVQNGGRASIEVPEHIRSSKFPGANRVRIHFGMDSVPPRAG